jgi:4-oxalocrotonate tautomerase
MPYINIRMIRDGAGATPEQKSEVIAGVTKVLQDVLGKNPATTWVVIDEVDAENWGVGGQSVADRRKQSG